MRKAKASQRFRTQSEEKKGIDCEIELIRAGILKRRDRSPEQLSRGWRRFNKTHHPDRGGDRDYWEKMKECKTWFENHPEEEESPLKDCEEKLRKHGILTADEPTLETVRKGWRKFALRHHPDKVGEVTQIWHEIKECKEWFERILKGDPGYSCVHKKCVLRRGGTFDTLAACESACGRDITPYNEEEKKRQEEEMRKRMEELRKKREEMRRRRDEIRRERRFVEPSAKPDPFEEFRYDTPEIRDKCRDPTPGLPPGLFELSKTQKFVRYFVTPKMKSKGILLWHAAGTGKTCGAMMIAGNFLHNYPRFDPLEQRMTQKRVMRRVLKDTRWRILWVTKKSEKNIPYKETFDNVCTSMMRSVILDDRPFVYHGREYRTPEEKLAFIKHSENWQNLQREFQTIANNSIVTYDQFIGYCQGNRSSPLVRPNSRGAEPPSSRFDWNGDRLYKTLVVIDEAHNLYNKSLNKEESRQLPKGGVRYIEGAVQKSYDLSGKLSVKLVLATATPMTSSPTDLFKLLNLLRPSGKMSTEVNDYVNEDGTRITDKGKQRFSRGSHGLISFFSGDKDPQFFAQKQWGHRSCANDDPSDLATEEERRLLYKGGDPNKCGVSEAQISPLQAKELHDKCVKSKKSLSEDEKMKCFRNLALSALTTRSKSVPILKEGGLSQEEIDTFMAKRRKWIASKFPKFTVTKTFTLSRGTYIDAEGQGDVDCFTGDNGKKRKKKDCDALDECARMTKQGCQSSRVEWDKVANDLRHAYSRFRENVRTLKPIVGDYQKLEKPEEKEEDDNDFGCPFSKVDKKSKKDGDGDSKNGGGEKKEDPFYRFVFKKCFPEDIDHYWRKNVQWCLAGHYTIQHMTLPMAFKWFKRVTTLLTKWNDKFNIEDFKKFKPLKKDLDKVDENGKLDLNDSKAVFPKRGAEKANLTMNIGGKGHFDGKAIRENICQISPVLAKIIKTIEAIDKADMDSADPKVGGRTYKHSVFTNTSNAKLMAAVFKAFGYYIPDIRDFRTVGRKKVLEPHPEPGQRVALVLSSTAMGDVKTNQNNFKMAVLDYYNQADNDFGQLAPVILLDAGFIEGTSLYNVKYAHIAEPPVSMAAFEQAVARSVRRCRSGRVPWVDGVGHVVDVFTYRATYGPWAATFAEGKEGEEAPKTVADSVQLHNEDLNESLIIDQFTLLGMRTAVDYYLNERILEFKLPNFKSAIEKGAALFGFRSEGGGDEVATRYIPIRDRVPVAENVFYGTYTNEMKFVKYLQKRFNNMRIWRDKHHKDSRMLHWDCPDKGRSRKRYLTWKGNRDLRPFFAAVAKEFRDYPYARFFVALVELQTQNCENPLGGGHLDMLIFDKLGGRKGRGSLELFEPHGATEYMYDHTELQNTIKRFAKETPTFAEYEFIPPLEICPDPAGFQRIEGREGEHIASDPGGWCVAWAFFYVENRLRYPDYEPQRLVKYLLEGLHRRKRWGEGSFTEFIREYANYAISHTSRSRS